MSKKTKDIIITTISIIILSFMIMSITFAFSRSVADFNFIKSYFKDVRLIFMNFIPIFLLMVFIYLIFNKLWASFLLTSLLFITLSIINKFKLTFRDDPFTFIDLRLFRESLIMVNEYPISLSPNMIIMLISLALLTLFLWKFFDYQLESKKARGISLVTLSVISIIIFKSFYFNPETYKELGDKSQINIWIKSQQFQTRGFVYPFIYSIQDAKDVKPEGYSKKTAIESLSTKEYKDIPQDEKVNIIAIMLEAYNDFSEFPGADIRPDVYENFHKLQEESLHGKLVTKIFAGDTIRTEREFLTGFYNEPKYYKRTNSFVWYFKDQGYRTEGMHPITGSFYNRRNVNEYLGFDYFEHYDNKYKEIPIDYLRDIDFFDYIIDGYEKNKDNNKPYFNFSVTYQNHGPYSSKKVTDEEYLRKKDHYDEETYNIINNFLSGISQTDKALKKLIDHFSNEEEPTILLIFGDHNPWLGHGNSGYEMLDISLDLSTVEGFENYYQTPYLIWGNDSAKSTFQKDFRGERNTISPNYLMAELFQYLEWEGNEYMQFILDMKEKFDVINPLYFKEGGEYVENLSPQGEEVFKEFLNLEYYYSH